MPSGLEALVPPRRYMGESTTAYNQRYRDWYYQNNPEGGGGDYLRRLPEQGRPGDYLSYLLDPRFTGPPITDPNLAVGANSAAADGGEPDIPIPPPSGPGEVVRPSDAFRSDDGYGVLGPVTEISRTPPPQATPNDPSIADTLVDIWEYYAPYVREGVSESVINPVVEFFSNPNTWWADPFITDQSEVPTEETRPVPDGMFDPNPTPGATTFNTPAAETHGGNDRTEPTLDERLLQQAADYALNRDSYTTNPALAENAENLKPNMYSDLMRFGFGMAAGESPFFGVNVGNAGIGMMDARQAGFADYQNALYDIENLELANQQAQSADEASRISAGLDLYRTTQPQDMSDLWGSLPADMVKKAYDARIAEITAMETNLGGVMPDGTPITRELIEDLKRKALQDFYPAFGPFGPMIFDNESGVEFDYTQ